MIKDNKFLVNLVKGLSKQQVFFFFWFMIASFFALLIYSYYRKNTRRNFRSPLDAGRAPRVDIRRLQEEKHKDLAKKSASDLKRP